MVKQKDWGKLRDDSLGMTIPSWLYNVYVDGVGTSTAQNFLVDISKGEAPWRYNKRGYPNKLGGKGFFVTGFDMNERTPGRFFCDMFRPCPASNSNEYIPFLLDYIKESSCPQTNLYVPIVDYGFQQVSRTEFPENTLVIISPEETIRICDNKETLSSFFRAQENVPFKLPSDINTFKLEYANFPKLVTKPKCGGRASLDVAFCSDIVSFNKQKKNLGNNFYAQEFIEGREFTIDALCNLDGRYLDSACRERLAVKAGVCQAARVFKDDRYEKATKFICDKLKFVGPLNIQFMENEQGIYLIEINPRFSGGLNLSMARGFHSPKYLFDMYRDWTNGRYDSEKDYTKDEFVAGYAYKYSEVVSEHLEGENIGTWRGDEIFEGKYYEGKYK